MKAIFQFFLKCKKNKLIAPHNLKRINYSLDRFAETQLDSQEDKNSFFKIHLLLKSLNYDTHIFKNIIRNHPKINHYPDILFLKKNLKHIDRIIEQNRKIKDLSLIS